MVGSKKYAHGSLGIHSNCDNSCYPQNARQRAFPSEDGINDSVDRVTYYASIKHLSCHPSACSRVSGWSWYFNNVGFPWLRLATAIPETPPNKQKWTWAPVAWWKIDLLVDSFYNGGGSDLFSQEYTLTVVVNLLLLPVLLLPESLQLNFLNFPYLLKQMISPQHLSNSEINEAMGFGVLTMGPLTNKQLNCTQVGVMKPQL